MMTKQLNQIKIFLLQGLYGISHKDLLEWAIVNIPEQKIKKLGKRPKKADLETLVSKSNIELVKKLISTFKKETAVHPIQLCEHLGISKAERLKWQKEGLLTVAYIDSWSFKYGDVPMFDRLAIASITPAKITKWRDSHQKKVTKNRSTGAKKAQETKTRNSQVRSVSSSYYKALVNSWESINAEAVPLMELAYWTVYVSRWAKYYQEKAWSASSRSLKSKYHERSDDLYEMKNDAIRLFFKRQEYCDFSKYIPPSPHKYNDRKVLSRIAQQIQNSGGDPWEELTYDDRWDFVETKQNHYYSLYYTLITVPGIDESFSFHTPYPVGKGFLPALNDLPDAKGHDSSEYEQGMHRFGRSVNEDEMISHSEKKSISEFERAYEAFEISKVVQNV